MRKVLKPASLTLAACVFLLTGLAAHADEARPRVVPVEPIHDARDVVKGATVEHTFVLRNEGDAPLEILRVRPTCGCTVTDYDEVIAPGESGRIEAVVDTLEFTGPIATSILVNTNDPDNPRLQLTIRADVRPFLQASPGYARYVVTQGITDAPVGQTVWALDDTELEVVRVESPYPFLATSFRPASEEERRGDRPGPQWRVTLTLSEDAPVGALGDHVIVHTNHPKQPKLPIPVSGFVRPMIAVTPPEVRLGDQEIGEDPLVIRLVVANYLEETIEFQGVEADVPGVEGELVPIEEGYRYHLLLSLGPETPKGELDTRVRIRTSNPKRPVVEIPLQGRIL